MKNPESEIVEKLEMTKEEIKEAKYELFKISSNSKEKEMYEKRKESLLNKVSALKNAEHKKALEIAKNLLDVLDDKTISLKTGISLDVVKKFR